MDTWVHFVDEEVGGEVVEALSLELPERITLRELIVRRVEAEVARHNADAAQRLFKGLVQPTDAERVLNGYALRRPRRIDPEVQVARALEAFARNGFFVLHGDRQLESLDELVDLSSDSTVSFLRLVPLVGG